MAKSKTKSSGIEYKDHYESLKSARFDVKQQQSHGGGQTNFKTGMSMKSVINLIEKRAIAENMDYNAAMAMAEHSLDRYNSTIENGVKSITKTQTYLDTKNKYDNMVESGEMSKEDRTRKLYNLRETAKQEREAAKATLLWMAFGDIEGIKNILDMDMKEIRGMFSSIEFQELVLRVNRATSQWRATGGSRERVK